MIVGALPEYSEPVSFGMFDSPHTVRGAPHTPRTLKGSARAATASRGRAGPQPPRSKAGDELSHCGLLWVNNGTVLVEWHAGQKVSSVS